MNLQGAPQRRKRFRARAHPDPKCWNLHYSGTRTAGDGAIGGVRRHQASASSGGASALRDGEIVAVNSFVLNSNCQGSGFGYRVDTTLVSTFSNMRVHALGHFVLGRYTLGQVGAVITAAQRCGCSAAHPATRAHDTIAVGSLEQAARIGRHRSEITAVYGCHASSGRAHRALGTLAVRGGRSRGRKRQAAGPCESLRLVRRVRIIHCRNALHPGELFTTCDGELCT